MTSPKPKKRVVKVGDKVLIIGSHPHAGDTGVVKFFAVNGAMVERDTKEERKFCMVTFNHLTFSN